MTLVSDCILIFFFKSATAAFIARNVAWRIFTRSIVSAEMIPTPIWNCSRTKRYACSRCFSLIFFESRTNSQFFLFSAFSRFEIRDSKFFSKTAAATTGPAKGPRPASVPHFDLFPPARLVAVGHRLVGQQRALPDDTARPDHDGTHQAGPFVDLGAAVHPGFADATKTRARAVCRPSLHGPQGHAQVGSRGGGARRLGWRLRMRANRTRKTKNVPRTRIRSPKSQVSGSKTGAPCVRANAGSSPANQGGTGEPWRP